jgi:hypothetical protein
MKFLKKSPDKCSVCGLEKPIVKQAKVMFVRMKYCQDCWDKYYIKYSGEATKKAMEDIKDGRMITNQKEFGERGMEVTKELTELFKCSMCTSTFKIKEELDEHIKSEHTN